MHEDYFASITWLDEAVTTLTVVPALDGSRSLVQVQCFPLFLGFLAQQKWSLGMVYENCVGYRLTLVKNWLRSHEQIGQRSTINEEIHQKVRGIAAVI
jgi:hypothetical protein